MSVNSIRDRTATIRRIPNTGTSRYNDPEGGTPADRAFIRVRFEWLSGTETVVAGERLRADGVLYLDAGFDILATDQVILDPEGTFEIVRPPMAERVVGRDLQTVVYLRQIIGAGS